MKERASSSQPSVTLPLPLMRRRIIALLTHCADVADVALSFCLFNFTKNNKNKLVRTECVSMTKRVQLIDRFEAAVDLGRSLCESHCIVSICHASIADPHTQTEISDASVCRCESA